MTRLLLDSVWTGSESVFGACKDLWVGLKGPKGVLFMRFSFVLLSLGCLPPLPDMAGTRQNQIAPKSIPGSQQ